LAFAYLLAGTLLVGCGSAGASTVDDLEKRVEALTKRVDDLEKQLQAVKAAAGGAGQGQAPSPLEQEAQGAFAQINQLVMDNKIDAAKAKLVEFQQKYGATRVGAGAARLQQELDIVGKDTPKAWGIEKWFQGESAVNLASKGTTVVVFWEEWCPHCRREVPKLQQIYETYKGKGLQLVGLTKVNRSSTDDSVKTFIAESKVTYPIAKEDGSLSEYFGVSGVPAAAVVKNGKVIWRGHPVRLTDEMVKAWL
jgi:thiol-disulfide isomerase/thioredoxin